MATRLLLFLLFCGSVQAAPFLASDVDPTGAADICVYQDGTQTPVETPVVVVAPSLTGSCKADIGSLTTGTHSLQVWFKSTVWGVVSNKTPFTFTRPSATATGPQNLKLVP